MINIIDVYVSENGDIKKDTSILAMSEENNSKTLAIHIPALISSKWIYLDFEKPNGVKSETERLEVKFRGIASYVEFTIPNTLLDEVGILKMEVIARDGDNLVWKSFTTSFTVRQAICATESILESQPDVIADLQKQIDNIKTTGGGTTIPIIKVEGSSVTLEPNKHYIISGVTNRLTISLAEAIETELKHYSFEFTSVDRIPTVTINGVDQPYNYEYEKNTKYLCEIVNNHLVILGTYDGYEYQFVYGVFATSDWTSSYDLKNDRTFIETASGATRSGTYQVEYSSNLSQYAIYLTFEDGDFKTAYWSEDGTITIDGVVYTKS